MKNKVKSHRPYRSFASVTAAIVLVLFCLQGCKKYYDPPFVFEEQAVNNKKKRKVLLVVIDGATGEDVKSIAPPKIGAMLTNSKYSYNTWSDVPVSDAGTWKNIMTGISGAKHAVKDSTFDIPEADNLHGEIEAFPTFIERLQASGKMKYSASVTPWKNLSDKLLIYTDQPVVVANDALVKDTAVAKIQEFKNDLVIANFNSVNIAGLKYGFSANVPEYKNALLQVDTYVGDLLEAVKSRKTYANEEWLIIVTSNHGGLDKGFTSGTKRERNVFTVYYNANFKGQEIPPLPVVNAINFTTKDTYASLPVADGALYNPGATAEFTVQFKIMLKSVPNNTTSHAVLLSKTNAAYGALNGWEFMWDASNKKYRVLLGTGASNTLVYLYGNINADLNVWTSLALKIFNKDGKRYAQIFNNGKPGSDPADITGRSIGLATTSLTIGTITSGVTPGVTSSSSIGTCSEIVSNLAIYNTALSDQAIQNFVCQDEITSTDPYYGNLVGYWPCSEGVGTKHVNRSPLAVGKDLIIKGTAWNMMASWSCEALQTGSLLMQNTDIAPQLYYWYGAAIDDKWKLDGKVFLGNFESEFIK